jgi:hypothetical protein
MFIALLYMFRATMPIIRRNKLYLCDTWYLSLYTDVCLVCRAEFCPAYQCAPSWLYSQDLASVQPRSTQIHESGKANCQYSTVCYAPRDYRRSPAMAQVVSRRPFKADALYWLPRWVMWILCWRKQQWGRILLRVLRYSPICVIPIMLHTQSTVTSAIIVVIDGVFI